MLPGSISIFFLSSFPFSGFLLKAVILLADVCVTLGGDRKGGSVRACAPLTRLPFPRRRLNIRFPPPHIHSSSLSQGGVSGSIAKTATAPIERVKLLIQTQDANPKVRKKKTAKKKKAEKNIYTRFPQPQKYTDSLGIQRRSATFCRARPLVFPFVILFLPPREGVARPCRAGV